MRVVLCECFECSLISFAYRTKQASIRASSVRYKYFILLIQKRRPTRVGFGFGGIVVMCSVIMSP